eukprot:14908456-Alexandrium_andersonii.AAC.1
MPRDPSPCRPRRPVTRLRGGRCRRVARTRPWAHPHPHRSRKRASEWRGPWPGRQGRTMSRFGRRRSG